MRKNVPWGKFKEQEYSFENKIPSFQYSIIPSAGQKHLAPKNLLDLIWL